MKHFILILLCAFSLKAYSQCKISLPPGTTYQFCGSQITVSAPIKDSVAYHYHWYYRTYINFSNHDSIAPFSGHSFTLIKKDYDTIAAITKRYFGIMPFIMLQIATDIPDTPVCPGGHISDRVYINISRLKPTVEAPQICLVTVDSLNHNRLVLAQSSQRPDSIVIQKLSGASWKSIATIKQNDLLEYTDVSSNASLQTYSYRLTSYLYDSCYAETVASAPSVIHTSILLQVSPNPTGGYNLSWSKYVGLNDSELVGYYIYRGGSYSSMQIIDTTQSLQNTAWNDPYNENAEYFYIIEAIKKNGCDIGQHLKKELSVRSNTALHKVNGITQVEYQKPSIRLEGSVLYTDKPCIVYIVNGIGQVTFSAKSNGELPLVFTRGLNIIMVDGKAVLKKIY